MNANAWQCDWDRANASLTRARALLCAISLAKGTDRSWLLASARSAYVTTLADLEPIFVRMAKARRQPLAEFKKSYRATPHIVAHIESTIATLAALERDHPKDQKPNG